MKKDLCDGRKKYFLELLGRKIKEPMDCRIFFSDAFRTRMASVMPGQNQGLGLKEL